VSPAPPRQLVQRGVDADLDTAATHRSAVHRGEQRAIGRIGAHLRGAGQHVHRTRQVEQLKVVEHHEDDGPHGIIVMGDACVSNVKTLTITAMYATRGEALSGRPGGSGASGRRHRGLGQRPELGQVTSGSVDWVPTCTLKPQSTPAMTRSSAAAAGDHEDGW
jgi:hypothetical protein